MSEVEDADWYFDNVLRFAEPGRGGVVFRPPSAAWQAWWQAKARDPAPVMAVASTQGFVVSSRQAAALGYTARRTATLVRRGLWTRTATRGVLAPLSVADDDLHLARRRLHALDCAAAALTHPAHVISGRSAAILHGAPTVRLPPRPETTGPSDSVLGRRSTSHIFGAALADHETTRWFGVRVTEPARTVVDAARHNRHDGLVVADAVLHDLLTTPTRLRAALDPATGWPGVRRARWVVNFADGRAESPLESLLRLAMHDDGFPAPQLQVPIAGYRVDMLLEDSGLVIEADGRAKYSDDALWREKRREQAIRPRRYRIERVIWDDVVRDWPATAMRLREAMRPQMPLPLRRRTATGG